MSDQDPKAAETVEALFKALSSLATTQTMMAGLLRDILAEQIAQRAAMERLAALVEVGRTTNYRPN